MFLLRAFLVWLIIICAETVHGILRTLFLTPQIGDFRARQIGVFIGSLLILGIGYIFIGWIRVENSKALLIVGLFWFFLTLSFEIIFGRFILNLEWERIFSDYDILHGGLLLFGLIFMIFTPLIAVKLRK